jgi:hypothetical protein
VVGDHLSTERHGEDGKVKSLARRRWRMIVHGRGGVEVQYQ